MPPQNHPVTLLDRPEVSVCRHGNGRVRLLLHCAGVVAGVEILAIPITDHGRTRRAPLVFSVDVRWARISRPMEPR